MNANVPYIPTDEDRELAKETLPQLQRLVARLKDKSAENTPRLVSGEDKIVLPANALALLTAFIEETAQGHAVSVVATATELTTQEAADFLQVSRPFIVKELEAGKISFVRRGRYRRLRMADLIAYQEEHSYRAEQALQKLADLSQQLGLDE